MSSSVVFKEIATKNGFLLGRATLSSEATLNSLTQEMIEQLRARLDAWKQNPKVVAIFLEGAGPKAFCAGGDIKKLYESITSDHVYADKFFHSEYSTDYRIHCSPKPVVVWGHGIVMGGGLGLFAGAALRVVTENTKMAMPEITIGLYPDVGATHFLNRMPSGCGLFLALTGARINAGDALFTKMADVFIPNAEREKFFDFLGQQAWSEDPIKNKGVLKEQAKKFAAEFLSAVPRSEVQARFSDIKTLAQAKSLADFELKLQKMTEGASADTYFQTAWQSFDKGSPTSAHVIFEQLRRGAKLSLKDAFNQELSMSLNFARGHDLAEGIRALLIDKDMQPRWQPAERSAVTADLVEKHFAKQSATIEEI